MGIESKINSKFVKVHDNIIWLKLRQRHVIVDLGCRLLYLIILYDYNIIIIIKYFVGCMVGYRRNWPGKGIPGHSWTSPTGVIEEPASASLE